MHICMRTKSLFCNLIGYRYTPLEGLPANPLASSEDGSEEDSGEHEGREVLGTSGMHRTPNPINKGIFPR